VQFLIGSLFFLAFLVSWSRIRADGTRLGSFLYALYPSPSCSPLFFGEGADAKTLDLPFRAHFAPAAVHLALVDLHRVKCPARILCFSSPALLGCLVRSGESILDVLRVFG
jgi:hypothetical protein